MTLLFCLLHMRHSPMAKVKVKVRRIDRVECILQLSLLKHWTEADGDLQSRLLNSHSHTGTSTSTRVCKYASIPDPIHRLVDARTLHVSLICRHDYDFVAKPGGSWTMLHPQSTMWLRLGLWLGRSCRQVNVSLINSESCVFVAYATYGVDVKYS